MPLGRTEPEREGLVVPTRPAPERIHLYELMAGQSRPLLDFEDVGDNWTRVNEAGMAPVVAVPAMAVNVGHERGARLGLGGGGKRLSGRG